MKNLVALVTLKLRFFMIKQVPFQRSCSCKRFGTNSTFGTRSKNQKDYLESINFDTILYPVCFSQVRGQTTSKIK